MRLLARIDREDSIFKSCQLEEESSVVVLNFPPRESIPYFGGIGVLGFFQDLGSSDIGVLDVGSRVSFEIESFIPVKYRVSFCVLHEVGVLDRTDTYRLSVGGCESHPFARYDSLYT